MLEKKNPMSNLVFYITDTGTNTNEVITCEASTVIEAIYLFKQFCDKIVVKTGKRYLALWLKTTEDDDTASHLTQYATTVISYTGHTINIEEFH